MPLLEIIIAAYKENGSSHKSVPTMLALSVMYGANIGGMGSITGTPANGILITFLGVNNVPNSENLTFATWLIWGIPIVLILIAAAWIILTGVFHTWHRFTTTHTVILSFKSNAHPFFMLSILLTLLYFISSFILSLLMISYADYSLTILIITGVFTLLFVAVLFLFPIKTDISKNYKEPLLKVKDCFSNLPIKGFVFVGISIFIAVLLFVFDAQVFFSEWINKNLPSGVSIFGLLLVLALITSFFTELLSNIAIQLSFFIIILPLSELMGFPAIEALLIVTLSSTCAFMSPIATGVNGLAFGGIKGVSFKMMLIIGFIMNIACALVISLWVRFVVSGIL